jgi:flavin reductase (DIM6/NTAB) family NADH-FMN oxidoreductase RutF
MASASSNRSERVLAAVPTEADQDVYRALAANAAKGVGVVTARQGRWDVAVTITDHLSISYDPPTMLVSLYALSRIAEAVTQADRWALSLLPDSLRPTADWLGEQGSPLVGLLGQVPHFRRDADGPALIDGALAWFELRTTAVHEAATHVLVVGEVVAMGSAAEPGAEPLVRFRSEYR